MCIRDSLYLLAAAAFAFTASPLLTVFSPESPWYQAIFLACSIAHQTLVFGGTLVCGRFSITGAHPALTASAVWLCSGIAIPGMLLAKAGLPDPGASPFVYRLVLLALYLAGMRLLRRAFPLPMPDCHEMCIRDSQITMDSLAPFSLDVVATIINRRNLTQTELDELRSHFSTDDRKALIYAVPNEPTIGQPTMGDVKKGLDAEVLFGANRLDRCV